MNQFIANHGLTIMTVVCVFLVIEVVRCWARISVLSRDIESLREMLLGWTRTAQELRGQVNELRDRLRHELSTQYGWENEAIFWRRHFDKDACEYVNSLEGDDNE